MKFFLKIECLRFLSLVSVNMNCNKKLICNKYKKSYVVV